MDNGGLSTWQDINDSITIIIGLVPYVILMSERLTGLTLNEEQHSTETFGDSSRQLGVTLTEILYKHCISNVELTSTSRCVMMNFLL